MGRSPEFSSNIERSPLDLARIPGPILRLFCAGIHAAHATAPNKWGLTEHPEMLRLNVGFSEILTLGTDSLRLLVNRSLLPKGLPKTVAIDLGTDKRGFYPFGSPGSALAEIALPTHSRTLAKVLSALKPGLIENIRISGRTGRGQGVKKGHSNSSVSRVAAAASIALPFPLYATGKLSFNDTDDIVAIEGRLEESLILRRRRNRGIVHAKIEQARQMNGRINCEACGMDPSEVYGEKAELVCEVHHVTALSNSDIPVKTALADLAILCPTCHRAIHLTKPLPTVQEFRRDLQRRAGGRPTDRGRVPRKL